MREFQQISVQFLVPENLFNLILWMNLLLHIVKIEIMYVSVEENSLGGVDVGGRLHVIKRTTHIIEY